MNPEVLYQWSEVVGEALSLGKRPAQRLSVFSVGVVWSERCTLSKVGERLAGVLGIQMDSVQRRLQRTLEDPKLKRQEVQRVWAKWVLSRVESREYVLLVDETKLGEPLNVMLVGLAYQHRCIPLAWVCYPPDTPGQVKRIERLLKQVKWGMPTGGQGVVQADRGIGTSPDLVRAGRRLGWHYLFRVQGQTKLMTRDGHEHTLSEHPSGWSGYGLLFKQRGPGRGYALVYQDFTHNEPGCLITDAPALSVLDYALRNWQDPAFRDLKSGGWNWQRSQVWRPDHADVLVLVLALAYAWVLSLGTLVAHAEPTVRARIVRGTGRLYSIFREGLRYWLDLVASPHSLDLGLFFAPDKLLT